MIPRERVLNAIAHEETGRPPFSWGLGVTPEMSRVMEHTCVKRGYSFAALQRATEHIRTITPEYAGPTLPAATDIWGIRRSAIAHDGGAYDEIVHHPLAGAESPADLEALRWPVAADHDFETLRSATVEDDPDHEWAHRLSIRASGNPLEIYTWMTGLEETLVNLLIRKDLVHAALDRITSHFESMMRAAARAVGDWIDIVYLADDLGGQTSLLFSRDTYREMIQPYHARLTRTAREVLPHAQVMYHTDGAVFDVIPDLIEAGVQILEAVQTDAAGMDPERLKDRYGRDLTFHGGIPVQSLLPHGTAEEVYARAGELCQTFGASGGYIAAPTHAVQLGTPPENVFAMLRAVLGEEGFAEAESTARQMESVPEAGTHYGGGDG